MRWGAGVAFGITGIAAGFAGTAVNRLMNPDVLLLGFAAVIVVAAVGMLANSGDETLLPEERRTSARTTLESRADRTDRRRRPARRLHDRLFGAGGGFVIVPALTLALGMSMPQAVATSLVVISINSAGALLASAPARLTSTGP